MPAYGLYDAREGRVAVAALEPQFRRRLYEALSLPDGAPLDTVFLDAAGARLGSVGAGRDLPLAAVRDDP